MQNLPAVAAPDDTFHRSHDKSQTPNRSRGAP
jgi:hypothetical protein